MKPSGTMKHCALCQNKSKLQKSHLLPKACYRPLNSKYGAPVFTQGGQSTATSKQQVEELLCRDCEILFAQKGENYVTSQMANPPKRMFKLRDRLNAHKPIDGDLETKRYDAKQVLGAKLVDFLYFAASIFWRASVWPTDIHKIHLGKTYQEEFRLYLLNRNPFPTKAHILVYVFTEQFLDLPHQSLPRTDKAHQCRVHAFHIPGILFYLWLGQRVPREIRDSSFSGTIKQFIYSSRWNIHSFITGALEAAKNAKQVGKLAKLKVK